MDDRKGRGATAEELFDHCVSLAGLSIKSQEEAAALRDEVTRTLADVKATHTEAMVRIGLLGKRIGEQGEELQSMYAPEAVERAATHAQEVVNIFENKAGRIFETIQRKADGAVWSYWWRLLMGVVVSAAGLGIVFSMFWWFIPSIDEVKSRRAELQQLDADINNALPGKVLDYKKGKWVQVTGTVQNLCDPEKNCAKYVRVR